MSDLLISCLSLREIGIIEDINGIIFTYIQDIKADIELDYEHYSLHGYGVYFDYDSFSDYSVRDKNKILRAMEAKYLDWHDMVKRKYENMSNEKLYKSMPVRDVSFIIKYPELLLDNNIRVTIIMSVSGKGRNRYYYGIGKFSVFCLKS